MWGTIGRPEAAGHRPAERRAPTGPRRRGLRRVVMVAIAVALALTMAQPAAAPAGVTAESLRTDPRLPLRTVVERRIAAGWICAGLPRPTATAPTSDAGGPARGHARCTGLGCAWEMSDDRLDGWAMVVAGPCALAGPGSTAVGPCRSGWMSVRGSTGTWVGAWSWFGPDDRLVVLAGTGDLDHLAFVGHWIRHDRGTERVEGLITPDRMVISALWPAPPV